MAKKRRGSCPIQELDFDKMPLYGDMRNGQISNFKKPTLSSYYFASPKILRKLDNVPCKGKIREKDKVIFLWGTPTCRGSTCANLTCRQSNEYPNQIKFELETKLRSKYVNLMFTEWIMGLPLGWTNPTSNVRKHPGYDREPCSRMVKRMPEHYHKRVKVLGNLCVSQQSRLAWNILMPRLESI